jgi:hypothetical protein
LYAKGNGLVLNAAKTQLMFSAAAGKVEDVVVMVDGAEILPGNTFELLGITLIGDSALGHTCPRWLQQLRVGHH